MSKSIKKWTPEEDEILLQQATLLSSQGNAKDWTAIANAIPGRSNKDCRKRWCNHLVGGLRKGPWDPSEDRRLAIGVKEYGQQWPLVAEEVGTRSADQCAKRWQHSLNPTLDHSKWTEEEEEKLLRVVEEHGRAWKHIQTQYFPERATNNVKNRYSTLTRKRGSQTGESKSQDMANGTGENNNGDMSSSEGTASPSPTTTAAPTSSEEDPVLSGGPDDTMLLGNDCFDHYPGDPLSLDLFTAAIPSSMDIDMAAGDFFTEDVLLDFSTTNYMHTAEESAAPSGINDSPFSSHGGRRFSCAVQPETHTGSQFGSDTDPQSLFMNVDFLQDHPVKLVLTMDNPSPEIITSIVKILAPSKTKFRMEMK